VRLTLTPSTDPDDYGFSHRVRARFAETDAMGIVHHAAYLPWLEEARVALLRHAGHPYDELRSTGVDLVVLEVFVRYRLPVRFDEVVDIDLTVGEVGRTTFQIGYLLRAGGEARATAVTVHGAVDTAGRARRLPPWFGDEQFTRP